MKVPPESQSELDRARADREATNWLILLKDDPDDFDTRSGFDAWLSANDVNAAAWAETQHVVAVMDATPAAHADYWEGSPGERPSATVTPITTAKRPQRIRRRVAVAAMTAVAACLAIVAAPDVLLRMQADHIAGTGEVRTVRLEDGSQVSLGAGSAIAVAFTGGERRVRLLRGEADFEIQRDPARPFRVVAHDVTATVLGTGFEVRLKDGATDVAVRHGLVQVDHDQGVPPVSTRLAAGERISVGWTGGSERGVMRPEKIAAWKSGKLIANNRPVSEVIDELRPWYGGLILVSGSGLDRQRVTGVYDLRDPMGALQALAKAHSATVRSISPWVLVISAH